MEPVVTYLINFGVAGAMLALVIIVLWRGSMALARWFAPRLDKVIDAHTGLMETLGTKVEDQAGSLDAQTKLMARQTEMTWIMAHSIRALARSASSFGPPTLLVIEDNASDIRLFREYCGPLCHEHGLHVVDVSTMADASGLIGQADAILLDVGLPDINHLESHQYFAELSGRPTVIWSGADNDEVRQMAKNIRAVDIVWKNDDQHESKLKAAVQSLVDILKGQHVIK